MVGALDDPSRWTLWPRGRADPGADFGNVGDLGLMTVGARVAAQETLRARQTGAVRRGDATA